MKDKNEDYYKGFNDAIDYILKWLEKDYSIEKTISISKLKMKLLSQLRDEYKQWMEGYIGKGGLSMRAEDGSKPKICD